MRKGRNKRLMKRITAIVISIMMVIMPMEAMGTETLDTGVDIQHIRTEVTESGYQVSILASSAAGIKDYSFDGGETWQESYTTVMEQLPYEMVMARDNNLNTVGRFCPVINEIEKTPNGETNGNVILTIDTSDNNPSARVKEYSFDGGETWQESNTKTYSANEEGIEIWIRDFYGHVCTYTGEIENIDKVSPEIEYTETYKDGEETIITIIAQDDKDEELEYSFDGGISWQEECYKSFESVPGDITVKVRDDAGNEVTSGLVMTGIERTTWNNQPLEGWSNDLIKVTANISSMAPTGVQYSFDGGESWQSSNNKNFSSYEPELTVMIKDNNNKISRGYTSVLYDEEYPYIERIDYSINEEGKIVATVEAFDNASGIKDYSFDYGNTWQEENRKEFDSYPDEDYYVYVRDKAGNYADENYAITGVYYNVNWTSGNAYIEVSAVNNGGVPYSLQGNVQPRVTPDAFIEYSFDGGQTWQENGYKTYNSYEENVKIIIRNEYNHYRTAYVPEVRYDGTAPENVYVQVKENEKGESILEIGATDEISGIKEYSFDGGESWQTENYKNVGITETPLNGIEVKVKDYANNITSNDLNLEINKIWTSASTAVEINEADNEDKILEYSFDGGETWQESNRKIYTEDEYVEAAVKYESTGIDKICKLSIPDIGIDETTPVIEAELEENGEGNYIINAQIYDSQSGISQAKWANGAQEAEYFTENGNGFNGNNYQFTGIADEIYTIYAKDNVGNETVHTLAAAQLIEGSTDHPLYGQFDYQISNAELAKYQIVLNNTQEYIDAIENGETILRNNLTEWLNNVTISTGIPLYDANKCITANAYNFSYETEEEGQETIISGYIIVSKHTKDMLTQIVYEQSFDEGSYSANKTYYYFNNWSGKGWEVEEGETEFDIYSKDANGKYKNVSNGMEMAEEDFEYFRGSARAKMLSRNYGYIESTDTDNREQIDRIYNLKTMMENNLNELYGEFEYGNYEEMAKYMITKETEEERITYEDIEGVELGEGIKIKDERGIISARGYNYRKGNETGYVVISTHTKEELLKEHEEGESLPEGYENGEYINGEIYFYDGERYYDKEGNEKEDTQGEISVLLSRNPYDIKAENEQIIEELNQLFMEYVEYLDSLPQPRALRAKWTTFRQSKTNYQGVRAMQYLLKYDGFLNDKADGYFGANTLAAVKAAQRHYGLVVDGICGPNTWEKIYYVVSRSNYASRTNVSLAAKYMLRCRYGYTVVDYHSSYYGPQTEGAVKDFQDKCGIRNQVVYGRVGRTTWMYLIGSDKDLSLGKSSSGGSGGSDSSSSGGGSGGYTNGYAATATGMAEYAYSRIGDHISTFYDDPIIKGSSDGKGGYQWCEPFIQYCAKKVGYKPSGGVSNLTKSSRGSIIFQASFIPKGYTYYIYLTADGVSGGHWGIAWSKTSTQIKAIEANTSYRGTNRSRAKDVTKVQMVQYNYNGMGKYVRDDNYTDYIKLYCINK